MAWNGKEQILWISTEQNSTVPGVGAALSVLPLPGKPISVTAGKESLFDDAKYEFSKKPGIVNFPGRNDPLLKATIGAHNIFVLEGSTVQDLEADVQTYIRKTFDEHTQGYVTDEYRDVLQDYVNRGFRYFAFDLILSTPDLHTKIPIQYHFESHYLYYPLKISGIGGKGDTEVRMMVFTNGRLASPATDGRGNLLCFDMDKVRGQDVAAFTRAELAALDPKLGAMFADNDQITGRLWQIIDTKLDEFERDIMIAE